MPVLATENTCTGCSACANICPHSALAIKPDKNSFLMPSIDYEKCVECKLCEKVCPVINGLNLKYHQPAEALAFWDNKTRIESSSGGAFSAIARWVIDRGGVVFGASWGEDFTCNHIPCEDKESLALLRGSKYLQSTIGKSFIAARLELQKGRYVLFTGTPCQIAGLRSFLIKPYDKLITVDIVCHGVPSNGLFLSYINKLKSEYKEYANIDKFEFRNRRGWGYAPTASITNGASHHLIGIPNIYMAAFDKAAIFRESCYDCQFNGLTRVGDITIADFWGIGRQGEPFKYDVSKGVSLVLANSPLGREIMDGMSDCFIEKRRLEEAVKYNPNLVRSSHKPQYREGLITDLLESSQTLDHINRKYHLINNGLKNRLRDLLIKTGCFWPLKSLINKIRCL